MASTAKAHIGKDHYRMVINAGKNSIIADEPLEHGGTDEGFNPYELLISALGACTCATLRMYADRKGIALDEIQVNLSLEKDEENNVTNIGREIKFIGNLSEDERQRLLVIANKCPVHKILSNPIHINTQLV